MARSTLLALAFATAIAPTIRAEPQSPRVGADGKQQAADAKQNQALVSASPGVGHADMNSVGGIYKSGSTTTDRSGVCAAAEALLGFRIAGETAFVLGYYGCFAPKATKKVTTSDWAGDVVESSDSTFAVHLLGVGFRAYVGGLYLQTLLGPLNRTGQEGGGLGLAFGLGHDFELGGSWRLGPGVRAMTFINTDGDRNNGEGSTSDSTFLVSAMASVTYF